MKTFLGLSWVPVAIFAIAVGCSTTIEDGVGSGGGNTTGHGHGHGHGPGPGPGPSQSHSHGSFTTGVSDGGFGGFSTGFTSTGFTSTGFGGFSGSGGFGGFSGSGGFGGFSGSGGFGGFSTGFGGFSSSIVSTGATMGCGDPQSQDPGCEMCLEGNCCVQQIRCSGGNPCGQYLECLDGCGNPTCQQACQNAFPQGENQYQNFLNCEANNCGPECNVSGGICDSGLSSSSPSCDACLGNECCAEYDAVSTDGDVQNLIACIQNHNDPACTGDPVASAAYHCTENHCHAICGF